MIINVAADIANLLAPATEFSDTFTLRPNTPTAATVTGILHTTQLNENRGQSLISDEQVKATFPTAAVATVEANDKLQGPLTAGSATQVLYRVLEVRTLPYAATELWLRETTA